MGSVYSLILSFLFIVLFKSRENAQVLAARSTPFDTALAAGPAGMICENSSGSQERWRSVLRRSC